MIPHSVSLNNHPEMPTVKEATVERLREVADAKEDEAVAEHLRKVADKIEEKNITRVERGVVAEL